MFNKPLKQVVGVAAGGVATLTIDPEAATLVGVKFKLAGTTFDKTYITRVKVKVGPRTIWDLTSAQLTAINNYKNGADKTNYLLLDFCERDQAIFPVKEIGGLDLMSLLPVGQVSIELTISGSAVAPVITAQGYYEQSQGNNGVLKYLPYTATQSFSGKQTLPLNFRGALVKRLFDFYSGTDWTSTADGNISRIECKKNGLTFFDQNCLDNRFDQTQFKKVPQSRLYVADFIIDNNHDAHVTTMRKTQQGVLIYDSFEINAYITDAGGSSQTIIVEALDDVTNL